MINFQLCRVGVDGAGIFVEPASGNDSASARVERRGDQRLFDEHFLRACPGSRRLRRSTAASQRGHTREWECRPEPWDSVGMRQREARSREHRASFMRPQIVKGSGRTRCTIVGASPRFLYSPRVFRAHRIVAPEGSRRFARRGMSDEKPLPGTRGRREMPKMPSTVCWTGSPRLGSSATTTWSSIVSVSSARTI